MNTQFNCMLFDQKKISNLYKERNRQLFLQKVKALTAVKGTNLCWRAYSHGANYEHEKDKQCDWGCGVVKIKTSYKKKRK